MAEVTVDTDDLITITQIAERLGVGRSTVSMWEARRELNGFPKPVIDLGPRMRIWSQKEVSAWLTK